MTAELEGRPTPEADHDRDTDIEEDEYAVEDIVDKRINKKTNATEYFVKWENYSHTENTWEPVEHLKCPDLILKFEEKREKEKQRLKALDKEKVKRRRSSSASTQESQKKKLRKDDCPGTSKTNEAKMLLEEVHVDTAEEEEEEENKEEKEVGGDDASSITEDNSSVDGVGSSQVTGFGRGLPIESIVGSCTDDDQNVSFFIKWKGADGMDLVDVDEIERRAPRELCVWYRDRLYTSIKSNPPPMG